VDARFLEPSNGRPEGRVATGDVEPALRRHFLPTLWDDGGLVGAQFAGDAEDIVPDGKLEVTDGGDPRCDGPGVMILDVAPILSEVDRDAVGTVRLGLEGSGQRLGFIRLPRFADGGDVIDIDVETLWSHSGMPGYTFRSMSQPKESVVNLARNMLVVVASVAFAVPLAAQKSAPRSPSAVVEEFMRATADSNLTRMAELWGTSRGSARETDYPKDYQKRMVIMNAYLKGISAKAVSEIDANTADQRIVTAELSNGTCRVVIPVTTVKTKSGWIVLNFDLNAAAKVNKPCDDRKEGGNPGA